MIKQLQYDYESDRLTFDGYGLHCGTTLEVLLPTDTGNGGVWECVRVEYSSGRWYIVRHLNVSPIGLWARM